MGSEAWSDIFAKWPPGVPTRGVVITRQGEQVPFVGFMRTDHFLLIQRAAPDTVGARQVIVPFGEIAGLKLTEVVQQKSLREMGFEGTLPKT